jgi:hypothetical protein
MSLFEDEPEVETLAAASSKPRDPATTSLELSVDAQSQEELLFCVQGLGRTEQVAAGETIFRPGREAVGMFWRTSWWGVADLTFSGHRLPESHQLSAEARPPRASNRALQTWSDPPQLSSLIGSLLTASLLCSRFPCAGEWSTMRTVFIPLLISAREDLNIIKLLST